MTKRVDPENLAGVAELGELFGVGRTTVSNWYDRRDRNGFPEIVLRLASGPIWNVDDVVKWYASYAPSKGHRAGALPTQVDGRWVPFRREAVQGA
jgi:hypothetical protein